MITPMDIVSAVANMDPFDSVGSKKIHDENDRAVGYLPSVAADVEKSGGWTPVTERLPEVGRPVLVQRADVSFDVTWLTYAVKCDPLRSEWAGEDDPDNPVVAWVPLPAPWVGR